MNSARRIVLRAVLDTNILVSASKTPDGRNAVLFDAACARRFRLVISPDLINELARVLRGRFRWVETDLQQRIRLVARNAEVITTVTRLTTITADPDDNRVLECALDGRADLIVSNDRHLLTLKSFRHIPIVVGPRLPPHPQPPLTCYTIAA